MLPLGANLGPSGKKKGRHRDQVRKVDILTVGTYWDWNSGRATAAVEHQTSLRPCTVPRNMREAVQECSQELQGLSAFAERAQ